MSQIETLRQGPIEAGKREDETVWKVTFYKGGSVEDFPSPTAVSMVVLYGNNKIIAVHNPRGWGIPSGHIEKGENFLETAQRELMEEATAKPRKDLDFQLCGGMISDYFSYPTSILILKTRVEKLPPFKRFLEVDNRRIVTPEEMIGIYYGNKEVMKGILEITGVLKE